MDLWFNQSVNQSKNQKVVAEDVMVSWKVKGSVAGVTMEYVVGTNGARYNTRS